YLVFYISTSLSLCAFFFSRHGDHRYLHSFPTRRSSDLCRSSACSRRTWTAPFPRWQGCRTNQACFRPRTADPGCFSCGRRRDARSEEQRLNSSHLGISYAVFCLKKKKNKKKEIIDE